MIGTLAEIARRLGGTVTKDGEAVIQNVAAVDDADNGSLTFAADEHYLRSALASRAAAILTESAIAERLDTARKPLLLVPSTRAALAALLAELQPARRKGPVRHPTAVVDASAHIAPDVVIGPLVVIGEGASVGAGTVLEAGVVIGAGARVGRDCTFGSRSMLLDRCIAGDEVVLQPGAIVGSDGFGYVVIDGEFRKIPQAGSVELGDRVEIGANTCIDRAQTGATKIGAGTKIDNLVQIGHNCRIGRNCVFAAQTGLAGTTLIGDFVMVGGQSAFKGHVRVGSNVRIAGASHIWGDVADGAFVSGRPAQAHRDELRLQVRIRHLDKLEARVEALERRLPPNGS
ncbi:MAG: UDP-3-O-(3-hydroxymyristoyl)glucosamine N-acyltransferase [Candidatus Eremiobacteraeota bacterium]|nr:UDP-3-O-(3-hydroxymyristoyl)glucosamine N-acyltransferase [Candidatus Eremiobacteraeota bacterium]